MITYKIKKATTDVSVVIRIIDSTDGTPETGVVWNTAGIDMQYRREGAAVVNITEATLAALTTAHTDGGFLHIGNGYYRLDLPDAACATGVNGVLVEGTVTGMVVIGCYIQLVDYDPFDTVRLGLTSLPNAAADAAGGLPISDAGGLDMDTLLGYLTAAVATAAALTTHDGKLDTVDNLVDTLIARLTAARAGYLDNLSGHTPQTGDTYAQLPTNFSSMGIETDGHVHTDLKQWLGTAPLALSSQRVQTHVGSMAAGVITATVIADAAIDAATLAADTDRYQCVLTMVIDSSGNNLYGADYFKNSEPIESGITLPKINVKKASDGSDLIAETALTEVASLGRYKHDESTNKITAGQLYKVKIKGTIGGSVREWNYHMWRDA